jgi:hypothetical protein
MTGNSNPVGNPVITQAHESISEAGSQKPADSEFDRFKGLASKLAQVPKAEVDEKRKKS